MKIMDRMFERFKLKFNDDDSFNALCECHHQYYGPSYHIFSRRLIKDILMKR